MNKPIEKPLPTLEQVKDSKFGCRLCLWYGVECHGADKFEPRWYEGKTPTCGNYVYND